MAGQTRDIEFETKKQLYNEIADEAQCSNCQRIFRPGDEIYLTVGRCARHYCSRCCTPFANNGRNIVLEKMLSNLPTACEFKKNGCQFVDYVNRIIYHEKTCPKREIICTHAFCKTRVSFSGLGEHLQNAHKINVNDENFAKKVGVNYLLSLNMASVPLVPLKGNGDETRFHGTGLKFKHDQDIFFVNIEVNRAKKVLILWVQLYGSRNRAHMFQYCAGLVDSSLGCATYIGPVKSLEDNKNEVFESQIGLNVPFRTLQQYIKNDQLNFEFRIEEKK